MKNRKLLFAVIETLILFVSYSLSFYIRHGFFFVNGGILYVFVFLIMAIINILVFLLFEQIDVFLDRGYLEELKSTIIIVLSNALLCVLFLYINKISNSFSRIILFITYIIYCILVIVFRFIYKSFIRNRSVFERKSILYICKKSDINTIDINSFTNTVCVCLYDNAKIKKVRSIEKIVSKDDLVSYISTNWVDEIIFLSYNKSLSGILKEIEKARIPYKIKINGFNEFGNTKYVIDEIGNQFYISKSVNKALNYQRALKRLMDIVGGFIGCLITLILVIIIGPIIYVKSPGNIFYISERVGKNGKVFRFYKFRSMVVNADELKERLQKNNISKNGMMFKVKDDPRIIPTIGSFIRKTSIDEFPQFFNVLKGDMSLVGTRPPTLDEWNKYNPYYRSRLSIKPGITGLWQVSGRSEITDFNEVVKLDNEYIDNWNLALDIKILFKTIFVVFNGEDNGAM